jgi:hypothetical protein
MTAPARGKKLILLVLVTSPSSAIACGVCVTASLDYVLPPIYAWALFSNLWLLTTGWLTSRYETKIRPTPRFGFSIFWVVISWLGSGVYGLTFAVLTGLLPLLTCLRAFLPGRLGIENERLRSWLRLVGYSAVIVLTVLLCSSSYILRHRTLGEYIVQWAGTTSASHQTRILDPKNPMALPTWRYVVDHAQSSLALKYATVSLAQYGDPDLDAPRIKAVIERERKNEPQYYQAEIELCLKKLEERKRKP